MIDWSATAAWIALIVSITGTIVSPIANTFLNNRHQLKLREMDLKEKNISDKNIIIHACISSIGACIANPSTDNLIKLGEHFHNVYPYIPQDKWDLFDSFYISAIELKASNCQQQYKALIHILASLLAA